MRSLEDLIIFFGNGYHDSILYTLLLDRCYNLFVINELIVTEEILKLLRDNNIFEFKEYNSGQAYNKTH